MNKTNNNYAKEMYASPVAKTVELELGSAVLLPASENFGNEGQAGRAIQSKENNTYNW